MSNHPAQRPRSGNDGAASPNGAAGFTRTPEQAADSIMAQHLAGLQQILVNLPRMVADAVGVAIQSSGPLGLCVTCLGRLQEWQRAHGDEVALARAKALEAAGGDEAAAAEGIIPFLRPELRPGGPEAAPSILNAQMIVNGTGVCVPDAPAAGLVPQQAQPARAPILVPPPGMSHAAAVHAARHDPNLPGMPEQVAEGMKG